MISNEDTTPWIEKYRPSDITEIKGNEIAISGLIKMIENNKLAHLIFYGPSGTGKTSTILACAKKLYGENYRNMILELNGSEERGINIIREQIKDFSTSTQITKCNINFKLIILDEADSMTYDAQFALRRVIENYTNNTRFCLICNYENKIISALKSRCIIFKFPPLPKNVHLERLKYIALNEKLLITECGLNAIVDLSGGDMRKSINLLQMYVLSTSDILENTITEELIYKYVKYPTQQEFNKLIDNIYDFNLSLEKVCNIFYEYKILHGITIQDILTNITKYLINNIDNLSNIIKILDKLGDLEIYISIYINEYLIIADIISTIRSFQD